MSSAWQKNCLRKRSSVGEIRTSWFKESRFWNNIPRGIFFTEGSQWSVQRRFSPKTLKDFGFGRKSIKGSIHFEVDENIENFFTSDDDINMKIFAFFFPLSKYLELCFCRSHSTRPTIFFTSFLQPAGIATDSFENRSSAYGRVQLVPKYISKVKLNRGYSPNILSEIMRFQENGSRGKHFAQFP